MVDCHKRSQHVKPELRVHWCSQNGSNQEVSCAIAAWILLTKHGREYNVVSYPTQVSKPPLLKSGKPESPCEHVGRAEMALLHAGIFNCQKSKEIKDKFQQNGKQLNQYLHSYEL